MNAETAVNETEATATPNEQQVNETQEAPKENLLTQDMVDRVIAERIQRVKTQYEKKYSNVDLERYNELVAKEEQARQTEMERRGEYEKLLKEQAEKFNSKIAQYESELHSIKVDGNLLQAASNNRAVNPEQVVSLLKNKVKLNEMGNVDVLDDNGNVRYDDNGNPLSPNALVQEFLSANPHFVSAGPNGTGTGQGVGKQTPVVETDISKLDMNNPAHRKQYAELMKAKGIYR